MNSRRNKSKSKESKYKSIVSEKEFGKLTGQFLEVDLLLPSGFTNPVAPQLYPWGAMLEIDLKRENREYSKWCYFTEESNRDQPCFSYDAIFEFQYVTNKEKSQRGHQQNRLKQKTICEYKIQRAEIIFCWSIKKRRPLYLIYQ